MTENRPLGRLLADALQGSTPYGAGLLARPIASQGLAGLLGMQSFAQRMAAMPQPAPADTARGMLSADFGRGITADDPRVDLAMALSTATPRAGIRAYHGSPHDFDRFDMSRIGTGEGAQAYGHGLYFAGNEGVARQYRDTLAPVRSQIPDDVAALPSELRSAVQTHAETAADALTAARRAQYMAAPLREMPLPQIQDMIERVRSARTGRMYEVNLRTDPSRLLDWDAPLSSQSPSVRDPILSIPEVARQNAAQTRLLGPDRGITGAGAYSVGTGWTRGSSLSADPGRAAEFSQRLRDAGIPGIQYLDQGSRAAGQGTRNYVMFDDNLIEIIRKYGIAGLLGSGAGYGMLSPTQAPQNP